MKKIIVALSLLLTIGFIAVPAYASAASVNIVPQCNGNNINGKPTSFCNDVGSQQSGAKNDPVIKIIKAAITVISYVTGVAAIILIIISGLTFITSGGDTQKVASAKSSLVAAMIGIVVTVLAQSIIIFVLDKVK